MLKWLVKIFAAIIVWVIVALIVGFLGGLLTTVDSVQVKYFGAFLAKSASLIGFLAGASYFIWGKLPAWPQINRQ